MPKRPVLQLSPTPEHLIALWLAIHGGDPARDRVGVLVAGSAVLDALEQESVREVTELRAQVVAVMQKSLSAYQ